MNRLDGILNGALYVMLGALGIVVAAIGSFSYNRSLGFAIALCAVNLGIFRVAGWATETRAGAAVPALCWVTTAGVFSLARSEGDVIITSTLLGLVFLVGGAVAAMGAVALTPASRSWLTGLPHDGRR